MPGLDRTGPTGMGPMTGRGRGFCGSFGGRGGRRAFGAGLGWGGPGRGWRHWNRDYGSPRWGWGRLQPFQESYYENFHMGDQEITILKEDAARLKEELNAIEQRLDQLEKSKGS